MIQQATNGNGGKNRISGGKAGGKNGNGNGRGNGHKASGSNGNGHHSKSNGKHLRLSMAEVELKIQQFEKVKTAAKAGYMEADRLEAEIIQALGVGKSLTLTDGRLARVVDNFRDAQGNPKIKAYKPCGVKLAEVEIK